MLNSPGVSPWKAGNFFERGEWGEGSKRKAGKKQDKRDREFLPRE